VLGSIGVAIYRGQVATELPAAVPDAAAAAAQDTLGAAVAVAADLPSALGAAVLDVAREAFVTGMHLTAAIAAVIAFGLAALSIFALRSHGGPGDDGAAVPDPREPDHVPHPAPSELAIAD
jgi:MFS transporter, DHA2 family, multidrug resistance protein